MFIESLLNENQIVYETIGGPSFSTSVVSVSGGAEQRNSNWQNSRSKFELGDRLCTKDELTTIIRFFMSVKGKAHGFRFKDWADCSVDTSEGIVKPLDGLGGRAFQLVKHYSQSLLSNDKIIRKPVDGTVSVYLNDLLEAVDLDATTGVITLKPSQTHLVTAVTTGATTTVTLNQPFTTTTGETLIGRAVYLSNLLGSANAALNDVPLTILSVAGNNIELAETTTGLWAAPSPTDGAPPATAKIYPVPLTVSWSGDFHVPVRFDTDEIKSRFDGKEGDLELHYLFALPLIEIKTDGQS